MSNAIHYNTVVYSNAWCLLRNVGKTKSGEASQLAHDMGRYILNENYISLLECNLHYFNFNQSIIYELQNTR